MRLELKKRSDADAIQVFRDNLHNLLLAAPAGPISVLGIDPGLRTGCKVAVVDETGKFLAHDVLYLHTSKNAAAGAGATLAALIAKHNVRAIAIGNGTASRETDAFVRDFLREHKLEQLFSVTVSEAGASVYSASDIARQEFPDLDLTVRGAISIARRLQDPLSELVKVDPKSIGVGQYQHDVDQRQLQQSLEDGDRELREPRRRRSQHLLVDAAALRGRRHRAHGAEHRRVSRPEREVPLARSS